MANIRAQWSNNIRLIDNEYTHPDNQQLASTEKDQASNLPD